MDTLYQSAKADLLQSQQQIEWLHHTTTVPPAEVGELLQRREAQGSSAKRQIAKYQYTKLVVAGGYTLAILPVLFLNTRSVRESFRS